MIKRNATTNWKGSGKDGSGHITVDSGIFKNAPMAYGTRFKEDDGTNPEELIGAAHSGCYSMALTFALEEAGFKPSQINTNCTVTFVDKEVTKSHLEINAVVPEINDKQFQNIAEDAAKNCPISQLLNCEITHYAKLNS